MTERHTHGLGGFEAMDRLAKAQHLVEVHEIPRERLAGIVLHEPLVDVHRDQHIVLDDDDDDWSEA